MSKKKYYKTLKKNQFKKKKKSIYLSSFINQNVIVFLKNSVLNKQIKSAMEGLKECSINVLRVFSFLKNPHNGCKVYNSRRL
jgi:hypothetical protein